jgi:DNA-binding MarR family transcriptional regulator
MENSSEPIREMALLEKIETDPDVTQLSLAVQLGVAVGTVNWHLKRMIAKGYIKVKRATRRKLRYIITPEGIAFRARLTVDYIEQSMLLYRNTRQRVRELLVEVKREGFVSVRIHENDVVANAADITDICRLTCLEQGIRVEEKANLPTLVVNGTKVILVPSESPDIADQRETNA